MTRLLAGIVLALAAATSVAAAEPTLGARLSPTVLVIERADTISIGNRSTVAVTATVQSIGDGWILNPVSFPLAVGEDRTVTVTASGPDDAVIRATLTRADGVTATDASALVLETRARHLRPWEDIPSSVWFTAAFVVLMASWAVLWRLRRRNTRRLGRLT